MRSYAMGNEAGLLMASWSKGRLEVPFPYFPEVILSHFLQKKQKRRLHSNRHHHAALAPKKTTQSYYTEHVVHRLFQPSAGDKPKKKPITT